MYISLYDVGLFFIFSIILIIGGYLIAVLHRIFGMLGHVRGVLSAHGDDISQIVSILPSTLTNVNELVVSLKETANQTNSALGSLQNNLIETVDDLRYGLENMVVYAKIIGEVWRAIFSKSG